MRPPAPPILFIASDRREAEPWVSRWDHAQPVTNLPVHWAKVGTWHDRGVIAIANGVGTQRAALAIDAARTLTKDFSALVSIGTAGALDPALSIADIITASAVTDGAATWPANNPNGPAIRSGLVRTSPHILRTAAEKKKLRESGAIIVEMEAAAVASAAQKLAVPFYCIRGVSDLENESFFIDFEQFLMPNGGFNVPRLVMYAVAHPSKGLPELIRLQQRTSAAAKKLGDYLANCKF